MHTRLATRHPWIVLLIGFVVVASMLPGLLRLHIRTDGAALVPQDAPEVLYDRALRADFGLNDQAVIVVQTATPNGIYTIPHLRLVQRISERLQALEEIGPLNVASLDTELSDRFQPGTLAFYDLLTPFPESDADCARVRDDVESNGLYVGNLVSRDGSAAAILFGTPLDVDRVALSHTVWDILSDIDPGDATLHPIGAPFAEALLGNHILEDLGIPMQVLGHTPASDRAAHDAHGLFALRTWIGEHIGLLPIAIVVMALVFWIGFGSAAAMTLPLLQVATCLVFTFGLMGTLGIPLYLTTAVLPVILTSIGVADEVHILGRYLQILRQTPTRGNAQAVRDTMAEMTQPVVRTSLTTMIGFASFALAAIVPVQTFGVFAAIGILFCMLWSLFATPALLTLLPQSWLRRGDRAGAAPATPAPAWALFGLRHPRLVLALTVLLALLSVDGIRRLQVQDSWIDGFDPQSDFYRATQAFNRGFFGPHILQICVDTGHALWEGRMRTNEVHDNVYWLAMKPDRPLAELHDALLSVRSADSTRTAKWDRIGHANPVWTAALDSAVAFGDSVALYPTAAAGSARFLLRLLDDEELVVQVETHRLDAPEALQQIASLAQFIRDQKQSTVGGVLGPSDYIATTNYIFHRRAEGTRVLPTQSRDVINLWRQFGRVRGEHYVYRVISDDHARGILTVYLENANYRDTQRLLQDIHNYAVEHLEPVGIHLGFAGDVAVSQTLIRAIVRTQVGSLLFSLVGILLFSVLLHRSWRLGLLILLPCAFAILLNFGFMGWVGMPLGVATSMFAGMVLGIGVDFAIHLLERLRRLRESGLERNAALAAALSIAGRPILLDACAVALGFGVLMLSRVPANARLGTVAVLCVATCVLTTLVLLPSLLRDRGATD